MSEKIHASAKVDPTAKIHESVYVDADAVVGPRTSIWHFSHVLPGARIGAGCSLGQNVVVSSTVTIGDNCKIQNNVSLYDGVTLEEGVFCGPSCVFTNVLTPRSEYPRKDGYGATIVRRGVTIGANATIVCGHTVKGLVKRVTTLGEYCTVAAGAVVTKDTLPNSLNAGVPAKRIGWVSHAGEVLRGDLTCPATGDVYEECVGRLVRTVNKSGLGGAA
jgi:UDP-2-acetamido-3-amino-2,3-dideoxy-glucuronate N-acetyltransferase